jgi:replicative DNA helicase
VSAQVEQIVRELREGALSPEAALEAFESPAVFIKNIELQPAPEVIPSGFATFDRYQFLKKGRSELLILAARPSMGKSALAFQIGAYVARKGNVLIYSLEMDKEQILTRLVAGTSGKAIKNLGKTSGDIKEKARQTLDGLNLAIDDRSGLNISTIRSSSLAFHKRYPLDLIIVDYLGLVKSRELGNKNNEIGEVTGGLKALAKELKCPVMALSQLNRECEKRGKDARGGSLGDFRPILSDLRDSGNIEQDADVIAFLSRQEVYDGTRPGVADIRIAKNRNGEVGDFVLKFSGQQTRFYDVEQDAL